MPEHPLALVTGGAHRLGRAFSLELARLGYAVLVHFHSAQDRARETISDLQACGVPAYSFQADLSDPDGIGSLFDYLDTLLDSADSKFGTLAVLVNSAAVMRRGDLKSLSVEAWNTTLSLNLRAPWLCAQQAFRRMRAGGLIVNITDVAAEKSWSAFPAYTVSKAALASLTRVMARSFAPEIRVNAIAPGLVLPADDFPANTWKELVARTPFRRSATPQEIASALELFIQNEYITGETITIDGGYSLI